ncbi:putative opa3-like protein [Erysiphe neolycopersici]|uniref:Putative opa3-like protein n=1 Tax=Erysiphe neolycopersici TaxID=212602 RepID=A0A420HMF5_9PEZI|nr:putative opa3-like protein [Erysiphe neolycopersici]
MASLPLFKLASLFVRHISKYGGNWIKSQAQEHPRFRVYAERYGQKMHQINMRMAVTLLKDTVAEKRVKDRSEPFVNKTEQNNMGEMKNLKDTAKEKPIPKNVPISVWKRKFRPLPEGKAVELFANVLGDTFVLLVAGTLISYEYVRTKGKPDINAEKIAELYNKLEELDRRERALENVNNDVKTKVEALEITLFEVKDNKIKK